MSPSLGSPSVRESLFLRSLFGQPRGSCLIIFELGDFPAAEAPDTFLLGERLVWMGIAVADILTTGTEAIPNGCVAVRAVVLVIECAGHG